MSAAASAATDSAATDKADPPPAKRNKRNCRLSRPIVFPAFPAPAQRLVLIAGALRNSVFRRLVELAPDKQRLTLLSALACVGPTVLAWVRAERAARLERQMKRERQALMDFYYSTGGEQGNWHRKQNWGSANEPVGEWPGVTVDEFGGVIKIYLDHDYLCGA
tara:strand:+ start:387 stop:875 length:489 start_codon:yes stop_codon:yes gene_type:complete